MSFPLPPHDPHVQMLERLKTSYMRTLVHLDASAPPVSACCSSSLASPAASPSQRTPKLRWMNEVRAKRASEKGPGEARPKRQKRDMMTLSCPSTLGSSTLPSRATSTFTSSATISSTLPVVTVSPFKNKEQCQDALKLLVDIRFLKETSNKLKDGDPTLVVLRQCCDDKLNAAIALMLSVCNDRS